MFPRMASLDERSDGFGGSEKCEPVDIFSESTVSRFMRKLLLSSFVVVGALVALVLNACAPQRTVLEQVLEAGELRVLTRNSPTTYYIGPHGPTGPEYELIQAFADELGVKVRLIEEDSLPVLLERIGRGEAHVAAAGLTVTEARQRFLRFGPAYQTITQQVVYRRGGLRPRSVADLAEGHLEVVAHSSHVEQLRALQAKYPELDWAESEDTTSTELMNLVAEEVIDFTIADSNEVSLIRRYHPEVQVAFDISEEQPLAWAFPKGDDDSLYQAAKRFFDNYAKSGELKHLLARHYGHVRDYDYAGTPTYMRHVNRRLPNYRELFEQAAERTGLDWMLLAAVAYQESHWNPLAVSPTGVRGMMMLTRVTARQLGVKKRTDAAQSIDGGARYLRSLIDRFADIPQPDRTWLALAAYNVGYGHVRDAMWITEKRGGDPTRWADVKESLPLLRRKKWYRQTKHGYARGHEPVRYVENIRSYYDILRWQLKREAPLEKMPRSILVFSSSAL